jgi:hypothetical protein
MTAPCPKPQELTRLLDGELTENRAASLRAHLVTCAACAVALAAQRRLVARIAAPIPDSPSPGALAAVMSRLGGEVPVPTARSPRRVLGMLGGLAAAAALASVGVALLPGRAPDHGAFTARGAVVEWTRKVGVDLWVLERAPRPIAAGDRLVEGTALVASFSNVDSSPAYLLAFAVDARDDVHWLYPAFVEPGSDPASIRLDPAVVHRALPESVILEDVSPGPLRFFLVVTREPLPVSSIESARGPARSLAALRARWPDARVDELPVTFGSPLSATP